MATLSKVKAAAKNFGATIEDEKVGESHACNARAPHRHLWKASGTHELADSTHRPWKPDYADMLARMAHGIEPCTDAACDFCNDK